MRVGSRDNGALAARLGTGSTPEVSRAYVPPARPTRPGPTPVPLAPAIAQPGTAAAQATPVATPAAAGGDFAGLVEVGGGRRLWLECRGTGSPTVILETGYRNTAEVWDTVALDPAADTTAVLPGVAAFTRVCAYDRPGTHPRRRPPQP